MKKENQQSNSEKRLVLMLSTKGKSVKEIAEEARAILESKEMLDDGGGIATAPAEKMVQDRHVLKRKQRSVDSGNQMGRIFTNT